MASQGAKQSSQQVAAVQEWSVLLVESSGDGDVLLRALAFQLSQQLGQQTVDPQFRDKNNGSVKFVLLRGGENMRACSGLTEC